MKTPFSLVISRSIRAHIPLARYGRASLAVLAVSIFGGQAMAAVVQGTVINQNTRRFLERATVQVQGTAFQTLTDQDGSFRLTGLPAGTHTVVASYSGLETVTQTITVTEDRPAQVELGLTSDVYTMGEFVVSSTVEGSAFAINQQRRAETARSVTSIDAFTDQSTGNPGEFLRNIPGIQMDYSQNEPNRIRLRGQDPTLTSVTMDETEIASAASSGTKRQLEARAFSALVRSLPAKPDNCVRAGRPVPCYDNYSRSGAHIRPS